MRLLTFTPRRLLLGALIATVVFEVLTLLLGGSLCTEDTISGHIGWLTYGIRLHHGYFGILLLLMALLLRSRRALVTPWLMVVGFGLLFSDLLHHFLILWPTTGDPQFSLLFTTPPEGEAAHQRLSFWTAVYVLEWGIRIGMLFVILQRSNQASSIAIAWLLVISFEPLFGAILYWVFGQTRLPPWRERRLARLPQALAVVGDHLSQHADETVWEPKLPKGVEPAAELATNLAHLPIMGGNAIELLHDYDDTLGRLCADIDAAVHHVHLLFYIFAVDKATEPILAALERAAQRGVQCRVLVDAFGSKKSRKCLLPRLRAAKVEVHEVLTTGLFDPKRARRDLRNHRKIAVIDGRIGYTGSQNLVDAQFKEGLTYEELMARVTGPVVLQLQYVFVADWYLETEKLLKQLDYFPDPEVTGDVPAQVLPSGPGYPTLQRLLVALLYEARERVVITTPYFIPDDPLVQAMETAVLRGVEVHLIVSKKMDQMLVGLAQRSYYEELLEAGVQIHIHRGNFLHAKHVSFDDVMALVGSTNMDIRSFRLNAEVAILVYDATVTAQLRQVQEGYFKKCETLNRDRWRRRPWGVRMVQNLARLFSPLL